VSKPEKPELQVFICGVVCDAGGRPEDGGHKFTVEFESEDGLSGGFECEKCGTDNISFSMRNGP